MNFCLYQINESPAEFTYMGIGSCPYAHSLEEIIPKHDQLLPSFVFDPRYKNVRVIHFDPCFDMKSELLESYFAKKGFDLLSKTDSGWQFLKNDGTIEVLLFAKRLEHDKDFGFFHNLCDLICNRGYRLVVQEYTGYSTESLYRKLYKNSKNPTFFRRRILFDITQGNDIGCCTDLTKYTVAYDKSGNFITLLLSTFEEIGQSIGLHPQTDACIRQYCVAQYRGVLNSIHVDYRRRVRGETVFSETGDYSHNSDPDILMALLQKKLVEIASVLEKLGIFTKDHQSQLQSHFKTYREDDVYKWYDKVYSLLKT